MAEGILGLGSSGSSGLNQELIDKLKAAEAKGQVDPYDIKLENWDKELEIMDEINLKVNDLLASIAKFDLYKSGTNAFEGIVASTSGTSALFDAIDVTGLSEGTNTVTITQLAQKDVYQSNTFSNKDELIVGGQDTNDSISITIKGTQYDFSTVGKSYDDIAKQINDNPNLIASVEQVGDSSFRLVIKSTQTGLDNELTITQNGVDLGFDNASNKVLSAQNMEANIDGVAYNVSSNTITIQGNLKMTAFELGTSSITIQKDNTQILPELKTMVEKYNQLVDLVDNELYDPDSPIDDTSTLRTMMGTIKDFFFGSYGGVDENGDDKNLNLFNYGFSVDKTGHMAIDDEILGKALTDNIDDIKELFIGVAEKPGLGTSLKEYLDDLDGYEGLLSQYGENMIKKKSDLEDEKTKAQEILDNKYTQMSLEFAAYTAIITQMEAAFGGMKMMMDQSTAR